MSGLFGTMQVSKLGMLAQQSALNTTSHNMSNVNTPGYSRQHVILSASRPITLAGPGQIGTGVNVVAITRTRDTFLDYQIRRESSNLADSIAKEKYLSEIEGIFNEPSDTAISKLLSEYYDAWQTLSLNPGKSEARQVVVQTAKQLTDLLNHTHKQLEDTKGNLETEKKQSVEDINNLLDQINELNKEIKKVTFAGNNPNDLLDSRDLLLDELSTKFGIDVTSENLNGIKLNADGTDINLIQNTEKDPKYHLKFDEKSGSYQFVQIDDKGKEITEDKDKNKIDPIDFKPSAGTIGGLLKLDEKIQSNIDKLNNLAKTIALSTNAIHSDGGGNRNFFAIKDKDGNIIDKYVKDPNTGDLIAESGKELNAGNITINDDLLKDPMLLNVNTSSTSGGEDGDRALVIAQLRDMKFIIDDETKGVNKDTTLEKFKENNGYNKGITSEGIVTFENNKDGASVEGYYKGIINTLGIEAQAAKRDVANKQMLLGSFIEKRESTSGVSIDEETINLVQFNHAYQANAKMISTVDELLDVVINGLKR
ncbi:flagellar hook-associated protein FlgK [Clostridium senegalense]|uniref:flagellar hook-associated protein FlgK n=1 Tax=Clostridium senegalense TaxID=1465809 RepID=UPI001C1088E1|nr:flagellar hook-associated protein FlgK [Clostridium senegalense]MBU5225398.1 flagellar hook-associated protein FlgK [Clostridium senegalense]